MLGTFFGSDIEIVEVYENKNGVKVAVFEYLDELFAKKYGEQIAPLSVIDHIKGDLECRCTELPDGRRQVCSVCQREEERKSRKESEE